LRPSATWFTAIFWTLSWGLWLYVLFHRGILVFLVMSTTALLLSLAMPTLDLASWYSQTIVAGLILFAALSVYGFVRCVHWKGTLADSLVGD
jgi:hypothetical protein